MRAKYGTDEGVYMAAIFKGQIEASGYPLVVTPPAALLAMGSPILNVKCLMEAPTGVDYNTAKAEGAVNIDATTPYALTFAFDSGVVEMSTFPFAADGKTMHTYRIVNLKGQPYQNAILGLRGLAQRVA